MKLSKLSDACVYMPCRFGSPNWRASSTSRTLMVLSPHSARMCASSQWLSGRQSCRARSTAGRLWSTNCSWSASGVMCAASKLGTAPPQVEIHGRSTVRKREARPAASWSSATSSSALVSCCCRVLASCVSSRMHVPRECRRSASARSRWKPSAPATIAAAHHHHDAQDEQHYLARVLIHTSVQLRRATRQPGLRRSEDGCSGGFKLHLPGWLLPAPLGLLLLHQLLKGAVLRHARLLEAHGDHARLCGVGWGCTGVRRGEGRYSRALLAVGGSGGVLGALWERGTPRAARRAWP
eukprot:scaffold13333_cov66-Phaeocystis_antarctica.AAC.3